MRGLREPPPGLEHGAAAIWREVVGSFSADRFPADESPLLERYCVLAAKMSRDLATADLHAAEFDLLGTMLQITPEAREQIAQIHRAMYLRPAWKADIFRR
ncbi:hypothetical protein [Roseomonas rosulenta]|uniref:hypothetical protein n=1 Tax=Roseomonas rosulenta TaxID=2748667 RepID=UPI0018DF3E27|nr:hypothetical protein [Roseomonas rosulenta]